MKIAILNNILLLGLLSIALDACNEGGGKLPSDSKYPLITESNLHPESNIVSTGLCPVFLLFTSDTKYAYAGNSCDGTISQYGYNKNSGELTVLSPSEVPTGLGVTFGGSFDPTGNYLAVTSSMQGAAYIYSINWSLVLISIFI